MSLRGNNVKQFVIKALIAAIPDLTADRSRRAISGTI